MTDIERHERSQVFDGIDVGKKSIMPVALDRAAQRTWPDNACREPTGHGGVRSPSLCPRVEDVLAAYLPGLEMRALLTCMQVRPRPMRGTPSTPKLLAACRIHCAR
jgi:hypothetical protein